jgi:hypothetical protein
MYQDTFLLRRKNMPVSKEERDNLNAIKKVNEIALSNINLEKDSENLSEASLYAKSMYNNGYTTSSLMGDAMTKQAALNKNVKELRKMYESYNRFNKEDYKNISSVMTLLGKLKMTGEITDQDRLAVNNIVDSEKFDFYLQYSIDLLDKQKALTGSLAEKFITMQDAFAVTQYRFVKEEGYIGKTASELTSGNKKNIVAQSCAPLFEYNELDHQADEMKNKYIYSDLATYNSSIKFLPVGTIRQIVKDCSKKEYEHDPDTLNLVAKCSSYIEELKKISNMKIENNTKKTREDGTNVVALLGETPLFAGNKFIKNKGKININTQASGNIEYTLYVMEGIATAKAEDKMSMNAHFDRFLDSYVKNNLLTSKDYIRDAMKIRKAIKANFKKNKNIMTAFIALDNFKELVLASPLDEEMKIAVCKSIDIQYTKKIAEYIDTNHDFIEFEKNTNMYFSSSWVLQFLAKEKLENSKSLYNALGLSSEKVNEEYKNILRQFPKNLDDKTTTPASLSKRNMEYVGINYANEEYSRDFLKFLKQNYANDEEVQSELKELAQTTNNIVDSYNIISPNSRNNLKIEKNWLSAIAEAIPYNEEQTKKTTQPEKVDAELIEEVKTEPTLDEPVEKSEEQNVDEIVLDGKPEIKNTTILEAKIVDDNKEKILTALSQAKDDLLENKAITENYILQYIQYAELKGLLGKIDKINAEKFSNLLSNLVYSNENRKEILKEINELNDYYFATPNKDAETNRFGAYLVTTFGWISSEELVAKSEEYCDIALDTISKMNSENDLREILSIIEIDIKENSQKSSKFITNYNRVVDEYNLYAEKDKKQHIISVDSTAITRLYETIKQNVNKVSVLEKEVAESEPALPEVKTAPIKPSVTRIIQPLVVKPIIVPVKKEFKKDIPVVDGKSIKDFAITKTLTAIKLLKNNLTKEYNALEEERIMDQADKKEKVANLNYISTKMSTLDVAIKDFEKFKRTYKSDEKDAESILLSWHNNSNLDTSKKSVYSTLEHLVSIIDRMAEVIDAHQKTTNDGKVNEEFFKDFPEGMNNKDYIDAYIIGVTNGKFNTFDRYIKHYVSLKMCDISSKNKEQEI